MSDYISRQGLRERLGIALDGDCEKCRYRGAFGCNQSGEHVRACEAIDDEPAADVVEVVRCKDCVYYNDTGCANGYGWCEDPLVSKGVWDYWYCANGKRRADNG